ncbi:AMP-binding protein [Oscillatoria amoena NRMC-F 0135]|nr:AMP-binding protein [Oscillatoria amoena NRMC-F 0135]
MHLFHLFDQSLIARADEEALSWQDRMFTFGEIEVASNQLCRMLREEGFLPGDRLCVQLANQPLMVFLYLACLKAGVIFVPINVLYKDREIQHILQDAEPRAFWKAPAEIPAWQSFPAQRPSLEQLSGATVASLIYTSGTTGLAKGAMLTHDNFAFNAITICSAWGMNAADRLLLSLPLFHVHGLGNGIHAWLLTGMKLRLLERFEKSRVAEEFREFRPTVFFGVPTMYVRLLELEAALAIDLARGVRLWVSGSAPLAEAVLAGFELRFGSRILERYGMTEALMIASNPLVGERRAGSVGPPLPGVKIEIRGDTNEVWVQGPNVCAGYWRQPQATADAIVQGWFRTGDIGGLSPDGYLTLHGRKSDLIISGGFNIYPREIEEFLLEQPEVLEAAVAARPDAARGEVPVAFIVMKPEASIAPSELPDELQRRCQASLASFKVPREFRMITALPRNALGKVQKHLLPL